MEYGTLYKLEVHNSRFLRTHKVEGGSVAFIWELFLKDTVGKKIRMLGIQSDGYQEMNKGEKFLFNRNVKLEVSILPLDFVGARLGYKEVL